MNNKHIACVLIVFLCVCIFEGVSMIRQRATAMQSEAQAARRDATTAEMTLRTQQAQLQDLKSKTADLIAYLNAWEPALSRFTTPESGELNIGAMIKQADLILLAQRFEVASNKTDTSVPSGVATIPQVVRAHLTIEDDFIKSINWFGQIETQLPCSRISDLSITRGQAGSDIRMDLVVDIPLATAPPTAP